MRRAAPVTALTLALALGALPARAQHPAGHDAAAGTEVAVGIGFDRLFPERVDVVTGDTVMWSNNSARVHTATADDVSFDSGRLGPTGTFGHRFVAPGDVAYHCTLHTFIRGVVSVHDLLLLPPPTAAAPRRSFVLHGRASSALAPGTPVSLEADGAPVASATVGDDGSFSTSFVPTTSSTYRAVAGGLSSPPVEVLVLDRRVTVTATRRAGGRTVLRANVAPGSRGGHVVLQLLLPERFGWWPVRKARLDRASGARFELRTRRRLKARVVLTLPDDATRLAISRTVTVGPPR